MNLLNHAKAPLEFLIQPPAFRKRIPNQILKFLLLTQEPAESAVFVLSPSDREMTLFAYTVVTSSITHAGGNFERVLTALVIGAPIAEAATQYLLLAGILKTTLPQHRHKKFTMHSDTMHSTET